MESLILFLLSTTLSASLKQTTQSDRFNLDAFDCRNPTKVVSFLTRDWCSPTNRSDTLLATKKTVTILQEAKFQIVRGIRCTKQVSKFLVYCGSYSHMKLFGPPTILEPSVITTDDCYDMYNRRAFIYRGQTIKVELNTIISIPMIVHGSVTNDENNIYCTGAKFAIDGEQHSNMLAFETVRLSMVDLSIQIGDRDVQELREMTTLSPSCVTDRKCVYGLHTYLIISPINKCRLRKIRTIEMQTMIITHDNKPTEYLINHDHKLIIRTLDTAKDANCDVQFHHTNYPELKIIIGEEIPAIDILQTQIDMDLELRISEEYLMYRTEELLMSRSTQMQAHLCTLGLNSLEYMERSPFHNDALIRARGHILQELKCSRVTVTVTLGYQRGDLCHTEYLPVYLGEEPVYLDAMNIVATNPVLDQVNCQGIFAPIFETNDGRLIQANPQISEVKITLSKPEYLGFHEAPLDHMEEVESLLYTKAEFEAYSEYLHSSRARKAISTAMTRKYCASTTSCGSYQPTEPGTFNLENLVNEVEDALDWKQWIMNSLQTGGQYASIIVLTVWIFQTLGKLLAVLNVRKKGFAWKTAIQLNFNLDHQLRDTLLRSVPAPVLPDSPELSPTVNVEPLALSE